MPLMSFLLPLAGVDFAQAAGAAFVTSWWCVLLPACWGWCSWCLCMVCSGLPWGGGGGGGWGEGIILTCPLCKLNVVIKNFVWYLFFVNTRCVN